MVKIAQLRDVISEFVEDGMTIALEGFTHLIPFAAGHEIIRQGRRDLELVRMTPDLIYDQLIGAGCARRLIFSWSGNPGVGSLHRFRDAVENSWPDILEIEEHTHAGMANRYVAGASGLPFAVMRGYQGTSLATNTANVRSIECPFTGEVLTAVAALNPDVGIVHAQRADRNGNVQLWGITGVQREIVLASHRAVVTVEELVDEFEETDGSQVIPAMAIDAISVVPGGARPSYAQGYYERDNQAYVDWDDVSRDRERFSSWLQTFVLRRSGDGDAGV